MDDPTPHTYASFNWEWLIISIPLLAALIIVVLAVWSFRRGWRPWALLLGAIGAALECWYLMMMLLPTEVEGILCGTTVSAARIRPYPGSFLDSTALACRDAGTQTVTIWLSIAVLTVVILAIVFRRKMRA